MVNRAKILIKLLCNLNVPDCVKSAFKLRKEMMKTFASDFFFHYD